jgi:predicted RND superfamily exporter protein
MGRYIVLLVWGVYTAVSIWGAANVDIDFKNTYFISADASINDYLERTDEYFKSGETINVIVDNENLDFTSSESQKALDDFNSKLENCEGCEQEWIKKGSLKSWYVGFKAYTQQKTTDATSACNEAWVNEVVESSKFYACLDEFLNSP